MLPTTNRQDQTGRTAKQNASMTTIAKPQSTEMDSAGSSRSSSDLQTAVPSCLRRIVKINLKTTATRTDSTECVRWKISNTCKVQTMLHSTNNLEEA